MSNSIYKKIKYLFRKRQNHRKMVTQNYRGLSTKVPASQLPRICFLKVTRHLASDFLVLMTVKGKTIEKW
jgi:hypothetical protein